MKRIIVIGAGLAGLSCGFRLVEKGYQVTILEKYEIVGGRTASWNMDDMEIESGLHNYFGFYWNTNQLLKDASIPIKEVVTWQDGGVVLFPNQKQTKYTAAPLAKPLQTVMSWVGNNHYLNWADKLQILKLTTMAFKDYLLNRDKLDTLTIDQYATIHGVSEKVKIRFLSPLSEGIFFLPITRMSMFIFSSLLFPFLPRILTLRVGSFNGPMTKVFSGRIAEAITNKGGVIKTKQEVTELVLENGKVVGVKVKDKKFTADVVVVATGIFAAQELLKKHFAKDQKFSKFLNLRTTPANSFQIELTEPVMENDLTHFGVTTLLGTFAEQSRSTFKNTRGRMSFVLGQPEITGKMDEKALLKLVMSELEKLGISIKGKVKNYRKVFWKHEFFSLEPGGATARPSNKTHIPGLVLAGDYTNQPFISTMEGAVTSGKLAAEIVVTN